MASFKEIKEKFNRLSAEEKELLLSDIYNFSPDMKLFLGNRFLGGMGEEFIQLMEKETIGKVYKNGIPGTPNGKTINSIINKAKKSSVDLRTLLKLEQLAYRGFIEFLHEFGGGPENFEDLACKHLENYLILIKNEVKNPKEINEVFQEVKDYLLAKDNMCTDSLDAVFEEITSLSVNR